MNDPHFTDDHLLELRKVAAGSSSEPTGPMLIAALATSDIAEWKLIHWDAGGRIESKRTLSENANMVMTHPPEWKLTDAGIIVLELISAYNRIVTEMDDLRHERGYACEKPCGYCCGCQLAHEELIDAFDSRVLENSDKVKNS